MSEFLELHVKGQPLLQPNAWDAGSARILAALGFAAIATTSSGFAATLGRRDGHITRDEALAHCRALSTAVDIPVAADLENCFADDPDDVAEAVEAAAGRLVITARAEDLLHGGSLDEAIARISAYSAVGADVVFVPGLRKAEDIRAVVSAVDRPVNVLVMPGCPPIAELAEMGVARISVGGSFAWTAYAALVAAASELRDAGTYGYASKLADVRAIINAALD